MSNKVYLILVASLVALSSSNGNYGYGQQYNTAAAAYCDRRAFDQAQTQIRIEVQQRPVSNHGAPPYDQSYPGMTNGFQGSSNVLTDSQCRLVRQHFNNLLLNAPLCEIVGQYQFTNVVQLIDQGRRYLQHYCERNQGYLYLQCFKGSDINNCEVTFSRNRFSTSTGYTGNQVSPQLGASGGTDVVQCRAYDQYRQCVNATVTRNCYHTDVEHVPSYLMDNARNLAYSCGPNQMFASSQPGSGGVYPPRRTDLMVYPNGPAGTNGFPGAGYSGSNYPSSSGSVIGGNYPSGSYNPTIVGSGYNPFSSRALPTNSLGTGSFGDRAGLVVLGTEACMMKVKPYENSCTDIMIQRQREARYGRSSNDVQRRICCTLFYHRDCLSRVVLEHCPESSRVVVDLLMSDRQREMSTNCRDYNREQCNGTPHRQASSASIVMLLLSALISYCLLQQ